MLLISLPWCLRFHFLQRPTSNGICSCCHLLLLVWHFYWASGYLRWSGCVGSSVSFSCQLDFTYQQKIHSKYNARKMERKCVVFFLIINITPHLEQNTMSIPYLSFSTDGKTILFRYLTWGIKHVALQNHHSKKKSNLSNVNCCQKQSHNFANIK